MPLRKRDREDLEDGEGGGLSNLGSEEMSITVIGAGNEVGRSCILLKYLGKQILLDCGIHPGYLGMAALPYFDEIEPEEIDLLLITHFHLDHAAALPYFTEHTGFKGRIFMTHPTKAVMRMLLNDYIKLVNVMTEDVLYNEKDLNKCIEKIELIDYHQVLEHEGIKFWCYNAGHVLGAAMFMIEIGGTHILYTGDYSMQDDRHLMAAEIPEISPDVLIVESTYGVQVHSPRPEREERFTRKIAQTVRRGGKCLIPVFALGRAQELLLILDEFWRENPDLHNIPVYYASRLASKAIRVYQTYINMMNHHIRKQMDVANPFKFHHITNLKGIDSFNDNQPCVVMASPGMLQSGVSRVLFDRWCSDEKNLVLIPGYSMEGTLAKKLLSNPDEVTGLDGRVRALKCSVEYLSFSAHVDFVENKSFMESTNPANIILVHGESTEMLRLKEELTKKFSTLPDGERPLVQNPKNCQKICIEFHRDKLAKAVGSLTEKLNYHPSKGEYTETETETDEGNKLSGLLVIKDFNSRIVAAEDLVSYTQLKLGSVRQSLSIPYYSSLESLLTFFSEVYEDVEVEPAETATDSARIRVMNGAIVIHFPNPVVKQQDEGGEPARLKFEWDASPVNDMVADSLIALAMQAQTTAGGIVLNGGGQRSNHCHHHHTHEKGSSMTGRSKLPLCPDRLEAVASLFVESYGKEAVKLDLENQVVSIYMPAAENKENGDDEADLSSTSSASLLFAEVKLKEIVGKGDWCVEVAQCNDPIQAKQIKERVERLGWSYTKAIR